MFITNHHQQGVSLIESMVALLVISIGLLGLAALQINSLRQNTSAYHQSQAVIIANNMADRVRANPNAFDDYIGVDTQNDYDQDCMEAECSTAQLSVADASDWKTMTSNLPSGRGIIRDNEGDMDIVVMWDDEGTGASGTECSGDPETDLTCYTITMMQDPDL